MAAKLITNGTIVTGSDIYEAELRIEEGRIAAIAPHGKLGRDGAEIIDARGRHVIPGGVDVHTHLDMPFMGTTSADDFESGTRAAAFGGTTCIIDFVIPQKGRPMREALQTWQAKAEGKACCDYGFHMCIVEWTESTPGELDAMVEEGITSFKLFTDYPGVFQIDDGALPHLKLFGRDGRLLEKFTDGDPKKIDLAVERALSARDADGKNDP